MELTPDEQQQRDARLQQKANEAEVMRDFCRHPGFLVLKRLVNEKIEDKKNEWLNAKNKEEAEELRLQTKPWNEVYHLIFKKIASGDAAVLALRAEREDSATAE